MSALYGTLQGDGRAKPQTRCAHRTTSASAQSHSGSVTVQLDRKEGPAELEYTVTIMTRNDSGTGGRTVLSVPLSMLIRAKSLKIS